MKRFVRCCLCAVAFCCVSDCARAELTVIKDYEGQQGFTLHRMTVTPAGEPVPALKHRFVVPLHLRKPGNAATHYLRSFGELSPNDRWRRIKDKYGEQAYEWYEYSTPVADLPMQDFRDAAPIFQKYADRFIAEASRCRRCDWGIEEMDLRGREAISYLLSDVQESRAISRALAYVSRLAIIDRRIEDAIEYIRMNYQLGQDFGKQRFLVSNLVGMAEVGLANQSVIELIGTRDSPNLFWALSELPRPIINMRESMNLEMSFGVRMFPLLLDVEEKEHSPDEWTRLVATMLNDLDASLDLFGTTKIPRDKTLARLGVAGISLFAYPAAKQRLVEGGKTLAEVEAMSVSQVLLIDTAREFQKHADDFEKWTFVPYRQMREPSLPPRRVEDGFGALLADLLLPAVTAARTAQMRLYWQMNAIRVVEALRMHAAASGSFPQSLSDITVVPVPRNPITEQPYEYRLDGEAAVLDLPFSDGMPGVAWRFELNLAK
ncbi:MAG: hypothetical protein AAGD11_05880 [Planctomycetota bacterium]